MNLDFNSFLLVALNLIGGFVAYMCKELKESIDKRFEKQSQDIKDVHNKIDHHVADYAIHRTR